MTRPWRRLDASTLTTVPVNTGVFALRDGADALVSVHMAGGRSPTGLRGVLQAVLEERAPREVDFTYVSTNNYFTLYHERSAFPDRFDATNPFLRRDGHTVAQRGPS
jgi:predicted ferric reductase